METLSSMEELKKVVDRAIENEKSLGLYVVVPGLEDPECIMNTARNLPGKMEYYSRAYDDELNHKNADGVKIIGYRESSINDMHFTVSVDTTELDETIEKAEELIDKLAEAHEMMKGIRE